MAEIPVEKKTGFPWLLALLGLALAALLAFWLLGDDDDAQLAYDADDRTAVAGALDLDGLRVTELTGDMSFIARSASGEEYFIVFDEVPTPGTAKEGMLDINVGNVVDVEGMMRPRDYRLPATVKATIPAGRSSFLYATEIEKR